MLKRSFVFLSIFCIISFASSFVFAANTTNGVQNTLNNVGNGMRNMVDGTKNTMQNVGNGVSNMMNNMGNGVENAVNNVENGMSRNSNETDMTNGTTTDGYTATRTGATNGTTNAGSNTVVWIILAVAGIAIIALVWYYNTQTNYRDNNRR